MSYVELNKNQLNFITEYKALCQKYGLELDNPDNRYSDKHKPIRLTSLPTDGSISHIVIDVTMK